MPPLSLSLFLNGRLYCCPAQVSQLSAGVPRDSSIVFFSALAICTEELHPRYDAGGDLVAPDIDLIEYIVRFKFDPDSVME